MRCAGAHVGGKWEGAVAGSGIRGEVGGRLVPASECGG